MAGEINSWSSSKEWHQNFVDDYNDLVIVPKSILIDIADAIRIKRDGTSAIEAGSVITTGNGIEPEDFATEITNIPNKMSRRQGQLSFPLTWNETTYRWEGSFTVPSALTNSQQIATIVFYTNQTADAGTASTSNPGRIAIYSRGAMQDAIVNNRTFNCLPTSEIFISGSSSGHRWASQWYPSSGSLEANTTYPHWVIDIEALFDATQRIPRNYTSGDTISVKFYAITGTPYTLTPNVLTEKYGTTCRALLTYDAFKGEWVG